MPCTPFEVRETCVKQRNRMAWAAQNRTASAGFRSFSTTLEWAYSCTTMRTESRSKCW